jgi:hypothetical protein
LYRATTQSQNGYKHVNRTTNLTVSEDRKKPNHINIFSIYLLTRREAEMLCKTDNSDKIKNGLMKILNTWLKTGRLKQDL